MNKWLTITITSGLLLCTGLVVAKAYTGAGSSFAYPILSKWSAMYKQQTGNEINYQAIGSGGGIEQLKQGTVNFAAVDMPLSNQTLKLHHWRQFPLISGGIVIATHIPGVKSNQLTLSGPVIAKIYQGTITQWDNKQITMLNPKLKLPHLRINVIHRSDSSGTSYNFTHYLSKISSSWKQQIGTGTTVAWPTGFGAEGNAGVALFLERTAGTIGYVEYSYAKQGKLAIAKMINAAGKVVAATPKTFASAANHADWKIVKNYNLLIINQPGKQSWPLMATTFILLPQDSVTNADLMPFFKWCYANGNRAALELDYVPLPSGTVT